jgi:hypothetical protein
MSVMGIFRQLTVAANRISPMASRRALWLLVSLFLLTEVISADNSERKKAILVETHSAPRCYGLDCPPWPTSPDLDFCFQVGDTYHTATSHPSGLPGANTAKRLLPLQGQSVEIVVTDKEISVATPKVNVHLKVVHNDPVFKLDACNRA